MELMLKRVKEKLSSFRGRFEKIPSEYRRWSALGILLALLFALPLTVWGLTSGNFELRKRAATGEVTPTPTPTPPRGPYSLTLINNQTNLTCKLGDPNCYYQTVVIAKNRIDKPLYNTTMWQSSPNNIMSFIGFDGKRTSGQSTTDRVVKPDEEAVNTLVKVTPPKALGKTYSTFYIDGKICNFNTTPPDCSFNGASSFTVTIDVVERIPRIAQCNQTCVSAGYQCVPGLTCVQVGAPTAGKVGGDKCRNSNCLEKTDCLCPTPVPRPTVTPTPTPTPTPWWWRLRPQLPKFRF